MGLGVVVAGAGRMGQIHARNLKIIDGVELLAIVDPDVERGRAFSEDLHTRFYTSLGEALDALKGVVDAVVAAPPIQAHVEVVKIAAEHGVDVFLEKPLAGSLAGCREIVEIVRRSGILLQVGYQRRFDKGYLGLRGAVGEGLIGSPLAAVFIARDPYPPLGAGIGRPYPGAVFDDMLTHEFDLVSWIFGFPPERIYAEARALCLEGLREYGDFDNVVVSISYREGPLVIIEASRCSAYGHDLRAEILGSRGMARLDNVPEHSLYIYGEGNTVKSPRLPYFQERFSEAYKNEIRSFIEAVARGEKPVPNEEDGLRACIIAEAAKTSASRREPVDLLPGLFPIT